MDPGADKQTLNKFMRLMREIQDFLSIKDDIADVVTTLRKIESEVNRLSEARNHIARFEDKYLPTTGNQKLYDFEKK